MNKLKRSRHKIEDNCVHVLILKRRNSERVKREFSRNMLNALDCC